MNDENNNVNGTSPIVQGENVVPTVEANGASAPVQEVVPTQEVAPVQEVVPTQDAAPVQEGSSEVVAEVVAPAGPQIKFNGQETVVFEVQPEKEGNPLVVILLIACIVGFVFLLPVVTKYFGAFDEKTPSTPISQPDPTNPTTNPGDDENDSTYVLKDKQNMVKVGELEFRNIVSSNNYGEHRISFLIINHGSTPFRFDKKYYFLLYDDDKNLLYRALIHSYDAIDVGATLTSHVVISKDAHRFATRYAIEEIDDTLYKDYDLRREDEGFGVLTCNYAYSDSTMTYYFTNGVLSKVKELYSETKKEDEKSYYSDNYENYSNLSDKLRGLGEGVNSLLDETSDHNSFTMTNTIDLSKLTENQVKELRQYRYFTYATPVKNVYFEMNAIGYTCS